MKKYNMKYLIRNILKEFEFPEPSRWRYWSYETVPTDWDFEFECAWDIVNTHFTDWVYEFYDDYDEDEIRQSLEADGLLPFGESIERVDEDTIKILTGAYGEPLGELRREG